MFVSTHCPAQLRLTLKSKHRYVNSLSQTEEKLEAKIKEVKQSAIRGPECDVCFQELRPSLRVVQCEFGYKVG